MDYDSVARISQVASLLMFIAMFGAVLVYACWPSSAKRFEKAQIKALDIDRPSNSTEGRS